MKKNYNDLSSYCINKFGGKLYKLSLSIATTCPNRDGTISNGGCIFCSKGGSGDFAQNVNMPIAEQIENAKKLVFNKLKNKDNIGYIAYFQSFTSTYLPPHILKEKLTETAKNPEIKVISIATRPDCLGEKVLGVLKETSKIKPVWVELGLQTASDKTARLINRGYETKVFLEAVEKLNSIGIEVIVHIIIGLPNETEQDLLKTIQLINSLSVKGIKLQLLHVLKDTALSKMEYTPLELEEYARLVGLCIRSLRQDIIIHRISGDGNKKELIAPLWSADKKKTLNYINRYLKDNNIVQGK